MKKKYLLLLYALLIAFMFPTTAFAGSINAAEQGIVNVISATYEYDGAYYKVADGYKAQVEEYLNRDEIDMSQEMADSYISQFYANIGVGITSGYMEKIGDVNPPKQDAPSTGGTGSSNENDNENNDEEDDKQDSNDSSDDNSSQSNGDEQTEVDTSKAEASEEEATEQTIIKIEKPQTDSENTISVVDENGNPVDNTAGSTKSGKLEYSVVPMDETMYVWGIETLNVHTEAYKDSEIIGSLVQGDKIKVVGAATTGWAQIEFDGQTGYVSATYLRTDGYLYNIGEDVELETQESITEELTSEEETKDYSDAETLTNQIRLEVVAIGVIVILLAVCVVIVFIHKSKNKKK